MTEVDDRSQPTAFLRVVRVPRSMLPRAPWYGLAKLARRNGETVVACLDMTGMIYGVLVPLSFDEESHPVDFNAEEIVACKILNERWERFLMSDWCPRRWHRRVI